MSRKQSTGLKHGMYVPPTFPHPIQPNQLIPPPKKVLLVRPPRSRRSHLGRRTPNATRQAASPRRTQPVVNAAWPRATPSTNPLRQSAHARHPNRRPDFHRPPPTLHIQAPRERTPPRSHRRAHLRSQEHTDADPTGFPPCYYSRGLYRGGSAVGAGL